MAKKKKSKSTYKENIDAFFAAHPYSRVLLGIFIVAVVIMVGMKYYRYKAQVDIGIYLWEHDGIIYQPEL